LMQPDALRARILLWAEEQIKLSKLPPNSGRVLEAVLYRGNLPRSGVASVAGASTRTATRIVSALTEAGVLTSDTPYAPVRLVFPAALAERWMPGLFPEKREWRLFLGPWIIHYHRYDHDATTNQVTIHIVIIVGVAMAFIVIIVAIVVVVVMASPSPASNPTRPPTLRSPSATETINRYTSSTPPPRRPAGP
jgi:hypothetical protein